MITGLWITISVLMFLLGYSAGLCVVLKTTLNLAIKELKEITETIERAGGSG